MRAQCMVGIERWYGPARFRIQRPRRPVGDGAWSEARGANPLAPDERLKRAWVSTYFDPFCWLPAGFSEGAGVLGVDGDADGADPLAPDLSLDDAELSVELDFSPDVDGDAAGLEP